MNLKKNIIFRADYELDLINKSKNSNGDDDSETIDSQPLYDIDSNSESNNVL